MTTNIQYNSSALLNQTYFGPVQEFPQRIEPLSIEETIKLLSKPSREIKHPVLQSTLYDPELEPRIL